MPKNTSKSLQKLIADQIKNLAEATDEAYISEKMQAFFSLSAKFHKYSVCNLWLIAWQCPHATRVAGYKKWNEFNRYVRKGEQGIAILAPLIYKSDDGDEKELRGFKPVYVFDVSQTDGDPLPEPPDWTSKVTGTAGTGTPSLLTT